MTGNLKFSACKVLAVKTFLIHLKCTPSHRACVNAYNVFNWVEMLMTFNCSFKRLPRRVCGERCFQSLVSMRLLTWRTRLQRH